MELKRKLILMYFGLFFVLKGRRARKISYSLVDSPKCLQQQQGWVRVKLGSGNDIQVSCVDDRDPIT